MKPKGKKLRRVRRSTFGIDGVVRVWNWQLNFFIQIVSSAGKKVSTMGHWFAMAVINLQVSNPLVSIYWQPNLLTIHILKISCFYTAAVKRDLKMEICSCHSGACSRMSEMLLIGFIIR